MTAPSRLAPSRLAPLLGAALLGACATAPEVVPALYVPDAVPVDWDRGWDGEADGLAAVVPLEVMAYDSATGHPLADVAVSVWSADPVRISAVPVDRLDWAGEDPAGEGWWDARRDAWFVVSEADRTDAEGTDVVTDADGLARLYLVVDALPDGPQPVSAAIAASPDASEETLVLLPR